MTALMLADAEAFKLITTLLVFVIIIGVNVVSAIRKNANARQRRERTKPPQAAGSPRASSARRAGQEIEDFLRSLGQKPTTTRRQPERPQPKPPQTPRPEPKPPVRRPEPLATRRPREEPQKRVTKTPSRAAARTEAAKRRQAQAARAAEQKKAAEARRKRTRRKPAEAEAALVEPVGAADALETKLPKGALKRAVMLREILGPCRAAQPYNAFKR